MKDKASGDERDGIEYCRSRVGKDAKVAGTDGTVVASRPHAPAFTYVALTLQYASGTFNNMADSTVQCDTKRYELRGLGLKIKLSLINTGL
jgi:hypothetical protein